MASRREFITTSVLGLTAAYLAPGAFVSKPAHAKSPQIFTGLVDGTAVGGYDTVAYFTDGKPAKGSKEITVEHNGAQWRFASEKNRDAFKADPDKYAPRYGGYCAYALALNALAKGDPEVWNIVDDKLYLNFNAPTKETWNADRQNYIKKADANWPAVLEK